MKRTTYILLGLFLSGILAIVVGTFVISSHGISRNANELHFGGEMKMKELPPFHAIIISDVDSRVSGSELYFEGGGMEIVPSTNGKNIFSCPQEAMQYLDLRVINDTLKIKFDYPVENLPEHLRNRSTIYAYGDAWNLQVAQTVDYINSNDSHLKLIFKGLVQDTLSAGTSMTIAVDSCRFTSLDIWKARILDLKSGEIDKLYLDLDNINSWGIDAKKLRLNTEYLTGSNNNVQLQKGECKQMYWIPKNADSELRVTLKEQSCITVDDSE